MRSSANHSSAMPDRTVFAYRTPLNVIGACIPTFFTLLFVLVSAQETVRRWWPDWALEQTKKMVS